MDTVSINSTFFDSNMNAVIIGVLLTGGFAVMAFFAKKIWNIFLTSITEKFDRIVKKIEKIEIEIKTIHKENLDNLEKISKHHALQNEKNDAVNKIQDDAFQKYIVEMEKFVGEQVQINKRLDDNDKNFRRDMKDVYGKQNELSNIIAKIDGKTSK